MSLLHHSAHFDAVGQSHAEGVETGGKAAEVEEQCNRDLEAFKNLHDKLTPENKERLANSGIEMHSEGDMKSVMGLMGLMTLMQ